MKRSVFRFFLFFLPLLVVLLSPVSGYAATFRNGDTVMVDETLTDLYAAGGTITIDSPVQNDLTVAGGTINLNAPVSGGLLAAGGTLNIEGKIGNTLRAAGGTIRISEPVQRDVVLFGGTITLDETASVSGDLIVNGGQINIQAPIGGNIYVNGGQVTINSSVGGNVEGEVENLILGRQAVIDGNLNYTSTQRATLRDGAMIRGQENFKQTENRDVDNAGKIAGIVTGFSIYKLIADILTGLVLIYLLYNFTRRVVETGRAEPLKNGLLGLAALIVGPILAIFLFILILPGFLGLVFYLLLILLSIVIGKLFVGWLILRWWYERDKRVYVLDWKAAIIGPIVLFLLLLIPVIGWLLGFIVFLIAMGALVSEVFSWSTAPKATAPEPSRVAPRSPRTTSRVSRKRS